MFSLSGVSPWSRVILWSRVTGIKIILFTSSFLPSPSRLIYVAVETHKQIFWFNWKIWKKFYWKVKVWNILIKFYILKMKQCATAQYNITPPPFPWNWNNFILPCICISDGPGVSLLATALTVLPKCLSLGGGREERLVPWQKPTTSLFWRVTTP